MPEKLPVYRIPDFTPAQGLARGIHVADLPAHRQKHAFVQAPHKQDFYLLLAVEAGHGSRTIDFTPSDVKPGSVFFLTPEFYRASREADTLQQFPFVLFQKTGRNHARTVLVERINTESAS